MFSEYGRQWFVKKNKNQRVEMSEFLRKATKSGISFTQATETLECIFKSDLNILESAFSKQE